MVTNQIERKILKQKDFDSILLKKKQYQSFFIILLQTLILKINFDLKNVE